MKKLIPWILALLALPAMAANNSAFAPNLGNNTVGLTVGVTSASVAVPSGLQINYVLTNIGTNPIYYTVCAPGSSCTATTTTSAAMLPNSQFVISGPPNMVIAAISTATGNTLYVTPGEGS